MLYSGCFFYALPQAICDAWAVKGEGANAKYVRSGSLCSYKGLLPAVLG